MPIEIISSQLRIGSSFAQGTAKHVAQGQRMPTAVSNSIISHNGASITLMSLLLLSAAIALSYFALTFLAAYHEPAAQLAVTDRKPLQHERFAFADHASGWLEKFDSVAKPNYSDVKQIQASLRDTTSIKRINATTSVACKPSKKVKPSKVTQLIVPNKNAEKVVEASTVKSFEPPSKLGRRISKRSVRRAPKLEKASAKPQRDWRMRVLFPDS